MNLNTKAILGGVGAFAIALILAFSVGINDNGYRTVVQWPSGTTKVHFEPGLYFQWFGSTWVYPDVLTEDFDGNSENDLPIPVRYQDGGKGHIHGVARLSLPIDAKSMLKVHKEFRSADGIRGKIFRPKLKEAANLTARFMTSEEAYTAKRGDFANWAEDQFENGVYKTALTTVEVELEPAQIDEQGKIVRKAVTREKEISIIDMSQGEPQHRTADITQYAFQVSGFSINDWTFEQKTLDQIDTKREAEMAIITSRAQAEKAKQQEQQAVAEGLRNVATAKYKEEVEKAKQVVIAERKKEVALIDAQRKVEVNEQNVFAQEQDVLAAREEAQAIELRSTAEADAKRRIMLADGALAQKLATYEAVNARYAEEFGKQKWVPELTMGESNGSGGNDAAAMINLLTAKTGKDLALDMSMKTN